MLMKLSKFLLLLTSGFYLFHFLFFWVFEGTDSYFYWAFANFIRTGKYFAPAPYYYTAPSTMEPPLYSVFLYLAGFIKRADIVIHLAQISSILLSAFFIFKIMKYYVKEKIAIFISLLFLLIPAHFIYVSHVVAETIAIFYLSLYLFLAHLIMNKKKIHVIRLLLVVSAVMTLQRYNFLPLFVFALFIFLFTKYKRKLADYLYLLVSVSILLTWIVINYSLNGAWSLSNSEGKHLYNRILHFDRLLPDVDNPSFIEFKKIVGENIDYFKPWWFYEPQLIAKLGSETKSSQLMQEVALSALKRNPWQYLINIPRFFIFAHNTNDMFHNNLFLVKNDMLKGCRTLDNIEFCRPIIQANFSYKIWDTLVELADNYYLHLWRYVNFLLLFPSILFAALQKNTFIKFCGFAYLTCLLLFISIEAPLPRYTYIFKPLGIILISFMSYKLIKQYIYAKKD